MQRVSALKNQLQAGKEKIDKVGGELGRYWHAALERDLRTKNVLCDLRERLQQLRARPLRQAVIDGAKEVRDQL